MKLKKLKKVKDNNQIVICNFNDILKITILDFFSYDCFFKILKRNFLDARVDLIQLDRLANKLIYGVLIIIKDEEHVYNILINDEYKFISRSTNTFTESKLVTFYTDKANSYEITERTTIEDQKFFRRFKNNQDTRVFPRNEAIMLLKDLLASLSKIDKLKCFFDIEEISEYKLMQKK